MKKNLLYLLLSTCLGIVPTSAFADTLHFVNTGGASVNGVSIYPYNFSINGSTTLASMLCLDFNREISVGETWNATASGIALDNSTLSTEYRALALITYGIATGYGGYSAADYQFADWDIFDPADVSSNSGYTSTADAIKNYALAEATDSSLIASGFYSNFTLYTPTSDTTGWTNGVPQRFLLYGAAPAVPVSPSPAPEPSSLMLLGSGLLSVGGMLRRRMKRA